MVSNEEIKRMLEAKRKGIDIKKEKADKANYKICPNCKTKNPEKALFCVKCGNKLDKNVKVECPSCGTPNPPNAKFCVGCGETLKKETTTAETETPEPAETEVQTQTTVETSETETPVNDVPKKTVSSSGIPSSLPEHGIISQAGSKKTCPSCKGENPKSSKFCVVCGEKFDDSKITGKEDKNGSLTEKPVIEVQDEAAKTSLLDKVEDKKEPVSDDASEVKTPEIKVPESFKNIQKEEKKPEKIVETAVSEKTVLEKEEEFDPVEKIKKAKELLDIGAITTEEFENIKKKYLEKI